MLKTIGFFLLKLAVVIGIGATLATCVHSALDVPLVSVSTTTGRCVRVELPDGSEGSCDKLPTKYERIMVK